MERLKFFRRPPASLSAALDQGFFSGANFVTNVLLARWLTPYDFGRVSLVLSLSFSMLLFYSNFFIEPLAVFAVTKFKAARGSYFRVLILLHAALSVILLVGAIGVYYFPMAAEDKWAAWMLLGASPFLLSIWLTRRLPYVSGCPELAAVISGLYAFLLIGLVVAGKNFDFFGPSQIILFFCISSALPFSCASCLLKTRNDSAPLHTRDIMRQHWGFSRWLVLASALSIPTLNVQTVLTSYFLGYEEVGILRSLGTLLMPAFLLIPSIANVAIPSMAEDIHGGSDDTAFRKGKSITLWLSIGILAYCLVIYLVRNELDSILFNGRYQGDMWLLAILSLGPIFMALGSGWNWLLRASQITWPVLVTTGLSSLVSLIGSIALMPSLGITGAAACSVLGPMAATAALLAFGRLWKARGL